MIPASGIEYPDWDRLIRDAHSANPGCTSRGLRKARDDAGRSSYEILADAVISAVPPVAAVLDLACGDGELIDQLNRQSRGCLRTVGVDRSLRELSLAQERTRATVIAADAARLPVQADMFDAVACHMALMLFAELPTVLRRLTHALKSGGLFAAIVQTSPQLSADLIRKPTADCRTAIMQWWEAEFDSGPPAPGTGSELEDDQRFAAVFADAGFDAPHRSIVRVTLHASPADIWDDYLASLYLIWALDAGRATRLRKVVLDTLSRHADSAERVRFDIALALLTAVKARRDGE